MIIGIPWWVFLCIVSIFFSGYMGVRAMQAEKELEKQFIEREGKVYLERMETERTMRHGKQRRQSSEQ